MPIKDQAISHRSDHSATQYDEWWRNTVIYQIYPRSFCDSNNDGIGDIAGITEKLPYIKALGVGAVWISPFFLSPMADFGYDVSDHCAIDPLFGTMDDFDCMIARAHALDLKILIDLVLSHTSSQHPWFAQSRSCRHNDKADWYVWADSKADGTPPNNWLSIFGGSAWEWDSRRCQYYLHNFLISQPDLNFHNRDVQDAALAIAAFWLEKGVDGFRLDTVNFYFHDQALRDNPPQPSGLKASTTPAVNPYSFQQHLYDKSRPENLDFLSRLRKLMDSFGIRATVGELGAEEDIYRLMGEYTAPSRLTMAYCFKLLGQQCAPGEIKQILGEMEAEINQGWPSWALSNHDVTRVRTRWGGPASKPEYSRLILSLLLCLRGTPCIYQGEELGLPEAEIAFEELKDPYGLRFWPEFKGRDGCRTPMPWDSGIYSGFSSACPWLPIPSSHRELNIAHQLTSQQSNLHHARQFVKWRQGQRTLQRGDFALVNADDPLIGFIRQWDNEALLCLFNTSDEPQHYILSHEDAAGSRFAPIKGHGFVADIENWHGGAQSGVRLPAYGAFFAKSTGTPV